MEAFVLEDPSPSLSMRLVRKTSSECPIHGRTHTSDNSIIYMNKEHICLDRSYIESRGRSREHDGVARTYSARMRCFRGIRDGEYFLGHLERAPEGWRATSLNIEIKKEHGKIKVESREIKTVSKVKGRESIKRCGEAPLRKVLKYEGKRSKSNTERSLKTRSRAVRKPRLLTAFTCEK